MLRHSEPPGYRRRQPPKRPKLAPFTDIIDRILEEDRPVHRKQHHTAKRIFERLRDEHGFTGKETIVKDYVRERRLRRREMFVPLSHPPGHAQADFGEADAIIAGVKYRAHFFVMTLPHSDACFVAAYPAATTEAWLDGHNRAFVFSAAFPNRFFTTTTSVWCRASCQMARGNERGRSAGCSPITSSRTATAVPARVPTWFGWNWCARQSPEAFGRPTGSPAPPWASDPRQPASFAAHLHCSVRRWNTPQRTVRFPSATLECSRCHE